MTDPTTHPASDDPARTDPTEKKCPACAEMIKAEARKCRYCGEALGSPATPTTVELTSKSHKGVQLIGVFLICAGVVSCVASSDTPENGGMAFSMMLFAVGLVLYIGGRISAWWGHG